MLFIIIIIINNYNDNVSNGWQLCHILSWESNNINNNNFDNKNNKK